MRAQFDETRKSPEHVIPTGDVVQFLQLRRTCLLARYRRALSESGDLGATDERWREACVEWADSVITDALGTLSVRPPLAGSVGGSARHATAGGTAVVAPPLGYVELTDLVSAATLLFDCFCKHLKEYADMHGQAGAAVLTVSSVLHTALMARLDASLLTRSRMLLAEVHEARQEERLRLGRDMHDRLGHAVAVARQSLDRYAIHRDTDPGEAERQVRRAWDLLDEALDVLPDMITEVRQHAVPRDLGTALREYARGAADCQVRVTVHGDETLLAEFVREETFLVLREALRNALRHSHAFFVAVEVTIKARSLFCSVQDDGIGFESERMHSDGARHGLQSMQERARLLGGFLRVRSRLGRGTRVELHVPVTPDPTP